MKIMVCYNGSDASKEALKLAEKHAKAFSAEIHVVTSVPGLGHAAGAEGTSGAGYKRDVENALEGGCDVRVAEVVADDITHGEALVSYAKAEGVDALFIGVEKASKVGKLLFGSTAQYVILSAPCPVTTVRSGAEEQP